MPSPNTATTKKVAQYFEEKFLEHGASPQGLDYGTEAAQLTRFAQFLKLLPEDKATAFSLNDYGCGYGRFAEFLKDNGYTSVAYRGFDVSAPMINSAKEQYGNVFADTQFHVIQHAHEMPQADYTIACGVFNVKLEASETDWMHFVLSCTDAMAKCSTKGFAFNSLTRYSDPDRMVSKLYYPDPCFVFDYCKRNYSKWVAILHDYGLYDFTTLVRYLD